MVSVCETMARVSVSVTFRTYPPLKASAEPRPPVVRVMTWPAGAPDCVSSFFVGVTFTE